MTDIANASALSGESEYLLAKRLDRILTVPRGEGRTIRDAYIRLADISEAGLITFLRQMYPELSANEAGLCGLIMLGIEPACISKIFGYDHEQTFYNKRKDIRKKLHLEHEMPLEGFLKEQIEQLRSENEDRLHGIMMRY
ncbi:MAG: hypothetical protein IJL93_04800 [Bacteroidales bacterium]|nr:hypothetical protein [Bacteroidales bacterium]